jgi:AraC family transcriptional regulator, melibiose operon regulatory protein
MASSGAQLPESDPERRAIGARGPVSIGCHLVLRFASSEVCFPRESLEVSLSPRACKVITTDCIGPPHGLHFGRHVPKHTRAGPVLNHFDEDRRQFAPYGLACDEWGPLPASRADSHDEIEINYVKKGTVTYLFGGQRAVVPAGRFTMFWASIPHQTIQFDGVTSYFVVTIPFSLFLQWSLPASLLLRLMMGEMLSEGECSRIHDDALLFDQWSRDLANPDHSFSQIVLMELEARILRFVMAADESAGLMSSETSSRGVPSTAGGKAEAMACFVARNFRRRLPIAEIANAVSLHPDYASTLFRETYGATLTSVITRHRIAEAQRRLLTTDEAITTIALDSGFDSLTRFNRAFKQIANVTPREFRKRRIWMTEEVRG